MKKEPTFDLTIRERLDFPYRIDQQIETFQTAIGNTMYSRREIEESITGLVKIIPTRWQDDKFREDLENAKTKLEEDVRPVFAGVRMKMELCLARNLPITEEYEVIDYWAQLQACIDVLDRLGMLSKREFIEAPTGMPFGETALPDGMNLQEYLATLEEDGADEPEKEG